ncbi:hypothetical protein [Cupriavidus sp. RAF12]|uniref:hypothetical protein n=1 Tax=Cupriavidus sp. RAF12 TaxID=3233050 RepID=UPI003F8F33FB
MKYQLFNVSGPDGKPHVGVHVGGKHVPFGDGAIDDLLKGWDKSQAHLARFVAEQAGGASSMNPNTITFLSPLYQRGVVYGAGANYRDHVVAMEKAFGMALTADPRGKGFHRAITFSRHGGASSRRIGKPCHTPGIRNSLPKRGDSVRVWTDGIGELETTLR